MSTNYIATVHKPTAVTDAVCGYFFHKTHQNLILAKGNILEFHSVLTDPKTRSVRLERDKDFQIFGEISALKLIKPLSRKAPCKPLLFFITEKHHVAFIEPASDNVPIEECESTSSDDEIEDKDWRANNQQGTKDGFIDTDTNLDNRSKFDILSERYRECSRPCSFNMAQSHVRSRSYDSLLKEDETTESSNLQINISPANESDEFSHLRGPFWGHTLKKRESTQPLVFTPILRRRLLRLPQSLLYRLFEMRPLLQLQMEDMPLDEDLSTDSDVDMSDDSPNAQHSKMTHSATSTGSVDRGYGTSEISDSLILPFARMADVPPGHKFIGHLDYPTIAHQSRQIIQRLHLPSISDEPCESSNSDQVLFRLQRQLLHASSNVKNVLSQELQSLSLINKQTTVSAEHYGFNARIEHSVTWPPLLPDVFCSKATHPIDVNSICNFGKLCDILANETVQPNKSDTYLTSLLLRLTEIRDRMEIEEVLDEISAILVTRPSSESDSEADDSSSQCSYRGPYGRRRTVSLGVGNENRWRRRHPRATVSSIASCAEGTIGDQHLRTRASGKVRDRSGRPCERGVVCAISSDHAVIALSLVVGAIKFIAVKATLNNGEGNVEHFNARVEPFRVLDMQFLSMPTGSTDNQKRRALCILSQDSQGESKLCIYDLSLREKYLRHTSRLADYIDINVGRRRRASRNSSLQNENALTSLVYDSSTNHVVPTTMGGAMFVGGKNIVFYPRLLQDFGSRQATHEDRADQGTDSLHYLRSELTFQHFKYISCWASVASSDNDFKYIMCEQGGHMLLVWLTAANKSSREDISKEFRHCALKDVHMASNDESLSSLYTLKVEYLGRVTSANVMVTLPFNYVFLGSKLGDSQLIRLEPTNKARPGTQRCPFIGLHVISTFYNIAPIVDMCLVPTIKRRCKETLSEQNVNEDYLLSDEHTINSTHQKTLVTCSNVGYHGTLRFLRNGLGLQRVFSCKTPKLCSAFSLGSFASNLVLLSYPTCSKLAKIVWFESEEQTETIDAPRCLFTPTFVEDCYFGFDFGSRTIRTDYNTNLLCQVTNKEIRLFSSQHNGISQYIDRWAPATAANISSAAVDLDERTIIVACGGNKLLRLNIAFNVVGLRINPRPSIVTICERIFSKESLSCVTMNNVLNKYVACGFWFSGNVHILSFDKLETLLVVDNACEQYAIPRSVAITNFASCTYIVVGDSSGHLSYVDLNALMDAPKVINWKRVKLGSEPIFIQEIQLNCLVDRRGELREEFRGLFVGGENPVVMFSPKPSKITLTNVNAQNVVSIHDWSHPRGDYLLMVSRNYNQSPRLGCDKVNLADRIELSVCRVKGLNEVQVKTLNLYETPRRIVYHRQSDCLAVLVYHSVPNSKASNNKAAISLQYDFSQCASYRAPTSAQLFDKLAGRPFANVSETTDVMKPASKRKSKDQSGPLLDETRKGRLDSTTDSATSSEISHPVRWNSPADSKTPQRWIDQEEHAVLLVSRGDLRFRASYFLRPDEQGCSITVCSFKFEQDCVMSGKELVVVGTGILKSGDIEPSSGRILIFELDMQNRSAPMLLVSETDVEGAVYSMGELEGFLVATINCRLKLFGFVGHPNFQSTEKSCPSLTLLETHSTNSLALYVKCRLNRCIIGDLLRSVELFELKCQSESADDPDETSYKLVSIARDHNPNWVTAIEILSPEVFAATENFCNLFVCTSRGHQTESTDDNDTERGDVQESIREVSLLHLGEFVNVIRYGSLVNQVTPEYADSSKMINTTIVDAFAGCGLFDQERTVNAAYHVRGSFMLGSVGGWIGQMMSISRRLYIFLWEIQKRLQTRLRSIGRIDHGEWRAFESEMKVEASSGFIDGSLLESLIDMNSSRVLEILRGIRIENTEVSTRNHLEPLFRLIEEMARLH